MRGRGRSKEPWADFFIRLTSGNLSWPDGEGVPRGGCRGRTHNVSLSYPELVGLTSSACSRETVKTFTTEKHTGSGIEPGFPNCEAHAFPRRHYTLPKLRNMCKSPTFSMI